MSKYDRVRRIIASSPFFIRKPSGEDYSFFNLILNDLSNQFQHEQVIIDVSSDVPQILSLSLSLYQLLYAKVISEEDNSRIKFIFPQNTINHVTRNIQQHLKQNNSIARSAIVDSLISIIVVFSLLFGVIYLKNGVQSPFSLCFNVIWGEPIIPDDLSSTIIIQKILYDVVLVLFIGAFVSQQIKPVNPVEYSEYISYCIGANKYYFRYWVLLPKNKYLYDAKVRLVVTEKAELNSGINSLHTLYEITENYNSIRGVRFLRLLGDEATKFSDVLCSAQSLLISLYIIGTDEAGLTYSAVKRYKKDAIMSGYYFVSIRKSEYLLQAQEALCLESGNRHSVIENSSSKEVMRYRHFNKLYKIDKNAAILPCNAKKDVLSAEEIVYGQYTGFRKWFLDSYSCIVSFFLGK